MQFNKLHRKLQQTSQARKKAVKSTLSNQVFMVQATLLSPVQPSMVEHQSKLEHDQKKKKKVDILLWHVVPNVPAMVRASFVMKSFEYTEHVLVKMC